MIRLIVPFVLSLSFLASVPTRGKNADPWIVSQKVIRMECGYEGDISPCFGAQVVIENPRLETTVVTLECGREEGDLKLYPRTRLTVNFEMVPPIRNENIPCRISRVRILR